MSTAHRPSRIVLIGLSGSGKSVVARLVARRLSWAWTDTDERVEAEAGRPIAEIFRADGEAEFRRLERSAIEQVARGDRLVLATGGGAPLDPVNRQWLWHDGFVVHLASRPATLVARMSGGRRAISSRPLIDGADPLDRLEQLAAERGSIYALADWTVQTDGLTAAEVAEEVAGAWERRAAQTAGRPGRIEQVAAQPVTAERLPERAPPAAGDPELAARVETPGGAYPAYVGWDALRRLPRWLREAGLGPVVHVVADQQVAKLYGDHLLGTLAEGGFEPQMHALNLSEAQKSLETAAEVYDRLVAVRAERKHVVLAFGGGVATDLGGWVAASYLRGMPLVHVSTSLLGMVDAAIGGKVAVNHREGKNLIGAFYQPKLVVADTALLQTLPRREFISGWAEVIKHALIMDTELLDWLEREADALLALDPELLTRVLRRSIALKAQVVSGDEREEGARMTLNYGHTTGHALEAVTGYQSLLHGEAVAIGMAAAARIARELSLIDQSLEDRQNALIKRFGLPMQAPPVSVDEVLAAMRLDKKVVGKALRFVLLSGPGQTVFRTDVPESLVRDAVAAVVRQ